MESASFRTATNLKVYFIILDYLLHSWYFFSNLTSFSHMVSYTLLKMCIIFNISTSRVELTTHDSRTLHTPDLVIHSASNTTAKIPTNEKSTATRIRGDPSTHLPFRIQNSPPGEAAHAVQTALSPVL